MVQSSHDNQKLWMSQESPFFNVDWILDQDTATCPPVRPWQAQSGAQSKLNRLKVLWSHPLEMKLIFCLPTAVTVLRVIHFITVKTASGLTKICCREEQWSSEMQTSFTMGSRDTPKKMAVKHVNSYKFFLSLYFVLLYFTVWNKKEQRQIAK